MDSINSQGGMGPQMYALKKAIDSQDQGIMKLLESVSCSSRFQCITSCRADRFRSNLDIKA
jgi:hypothetical protein